jgi:hypothetical protein
MAHNRYNRRPGQQASLLAILAMPFLDFGNNAAHRALLRPGLVAEAFDRFGSHLIVYHLVDVGHYAASHQLLDDINGANTQ